MDAMANTDNTKTCTVCGNDTDHDVLDTSSVTLCACCATRDRQLRPSDVLFFRGRRH
jgi:hypothetical protein